MNNQMNELETYVAPGTNTVLSKNWQIFLVNNFKTNHLGLHLFGDHYITVMREWNNQLWAIVHEKDFYIQTDNGYKQVHENGFSYRLN